MDTILIPAHGKDYKTVVEVVRDYEKGIDFVISDISHAYNGRYCSCRDFVNKRVKIRYNKLSEFTFITYKPKQ